MNARKLDNDIKNCIILEVLYKFQIQSLKLKYTQLSVFFKKYPKMGFNTIPFVNSLL